MPKKKINLPRLGSTYLVPLPDGRFGACRVIQVEPNNVLVACTKFIGKEVPPIDHPDLRTILQDRYALGLDVLVSNPQYAGEPCTLRLPVGPPDEYRFIGIILPSREESSVVNKRGALEWYFAERIYSTWLREHDPAGYERLCEERRKQDKIIQSKIKIRENRRRAALSLSAMSRKKYFSDWTHVSAEIRTEARRIVHRAVKRLQSTEVGTDAEKVKVIRQCIECFNVLDERAGEFIGTADREDILDCVDDMVRLSGLDEEEAAQLIDEWRTW